MKKSEEKNLSPLIGLTFSHEHKAAEFWARNKEELESLVDLYLEKISKLE